MTRQAVTGTARAELAVRCLDLSLGGALLVVTTALAEGSTHGFRLDLDDETLVVRGEVRRCQQQEGGAGYEVGVRFLAMSPEEQARLEGYLKRNGS
jgi:c-di-GMP-binding flagellar brake protein YcgR